MGFVSTASKGAVGAWIQATSATNAADVTTNSATLVTLGVDCTFAADGQSTYVYELSCIVAVLTAGDFINCQLVENPAGTNVNLGNIAQSANGGSTLRQNWLVHYFRAPSAGTVVWRGMIQRAAGTGGTSGCYGSGGSGNFPITARVFRVT